MNVLTYLRLSAKNAARDLGASEEGAVATEYVFLLVLIALAIVLGVTLLGEELGNAFTTAEKGVAEGAGGTVGTG